MILQCPCGGTDRFNGLFDGVVTAAHRFPRDDLGRVRLLELEVDHTQPKHKFRHQFHHDVEEATPSSDPLNLPSLPSVQGHQPGRRPGDGTCPRHRPRRLGRRLHSSTDPSNFRKPRHEVLPASLPVPRLGRRSRTMFHSCNRARLTSVERLADKRRGRRRAGLSMLLLKSLRRHRPLHRHVRRRRGDIT